MAATKINLTKTHARLLMLMWYRVVPMKPFQHKSLSYESFVTRKYPDLLYIDVLYCFIPTSQFLPQESTLKYSSHLGVYNLVLI